MHGAQICKDENRNGCVGLYVFVNTTTVAESDESSFFGNFAHPLEIFVHKTSRISDSISAELTRANSILL